MAWADEYFFCWNPLVTPIKWLIPIPSRVGKWYLVQAWKLHWAEWVSLSKHAIFNIYRTYPTTSLSFPCKCHCQIFRRYHFSSVPTLAVTLIALATQHQFIANLPWSWHSKHKLCMVKADSHTSLVKFLRIIGMHLVQWLKKVGTWFMVARRLSFACWSYH